MRPVALSSLMLAVAIAAAQAPTADIFKEFTFRGIGPAVTGGRVIDVEGHPTQPGLIWIGSASGGVWKSTNSGTTWTPVFDGQPSFSIGDVALAPTNPNMVWVGTGEHNNQRSAHYGDGVYKSIDGGKTWTNMGLRESLHIGRIGVDPKNPEVVWVASVGPLYKGGGERGVYKTTNGGKNWQLVLKGANDTTGFIDLAIDPNDPNTVYTAAYDRLRRAWNIRESGPGSALYRTRDGGKTWKKLENGFPGGTQIGRIGLSIYAKNTKTVLATVENLDRQVGRGLYKTTDGGDTWKKINESRVEASYYYSKVRVDPTDENIVYVLGVQLQKSTDGGKRFVNVTRRMHVDNHTLWIDPNNNQRVLCGNDGGFYITHDQGENWDFINNLPIPQFYAIGADMAVPYNVMGGLQDNGVWHGPSRTRWQGGIPNAVWRSIYGGDGFYTIADPEDPMTVYTSSQFGAVGRVDVRTGATRSIRPRDQGQRANWMSPFLISPHNAKLLYWGAQKLYKTLNRGDSWTPISPDLTTNNAEKLRGNVPHCTITTIDESPVRAGVIWVGTDDGNVWVTENGGGNWTQVNDNMPGAPKEWWVSRVTASPFAAGTAFVSITGFREEDFRPFLYKTEDYGKTWTLVSGNLPQEQIAVVKQDTKNRNLLFVGTEKGCYASIDGGTSYTKLGTGLPMATPVQDLLVHPRDGDLVIGTHGRGIYIVDVEPLRQLSQRVLDSDVHIFSPKPALTQQISGSMFDAFTGARAYLGQNPPWGATIAYYLKTGAQADVKVEVLDATGTVIRDFNGDKSPGIHFINWNLRPAQNRPTPITVGNYGVRITVGDKTQSTILELQQ